MYLWHVSQDPQDYRRLVELTQGSSRDTLAYKKGKGDWEHAGPWLAFVEGRNPGYPVQILKATYAETLRRLDVIRRDRSVPSEQDVHHWQNRNPVILEGLVQLMLGCPNHVYHGGLLHAGSSTSIRPASVPGCLPTWPRWWTASLRTGSRCN